MNPLGPEDKKEAESLRRRLESLTVNLLDSYEELDLIYRTAERIMVNTEIHRQLQLIVEEASQVFEAEWSWIYLPDVHGSAQVFPGRVPQPFLLDILHDRILKGRMPKGRTFTLNALPSDVPDFEPASPCGLHAQVLKSEQEVYGFLCVGWNAPGRFFTSGEAKLANVLGTMASLALQNDSLHRQRREEEKALLRIQEEMRLASRIQRDLLPQSAPRIEGYDLAGYTQPALTVGGDYFDFIPLGGQRLAVALGDVSGKGLPASLLMANLQATIRGQALLDASPAVALQVSNRLLLASTSDAKFVTLVYGALDVKDHRFLYSNAGHDPPLLFPVHGAPRELSVGGLVLGVMDNAAYREEGVSLQPGEMLLLYSDGIPEAQNGAECEFGVEALVRLVQEHRAEPAPRLIERIFCAVREHCGSDVQQDDQTVILIRRLPLNKEGPHPSSVPSAVSV